MTESSRQLSNSSQHKMPLKQLFKRSSTANLKAVSVGDEGLASGSGNNGHGQDTSYYSSFPKKSTTHNNNIGHDGSSSNYSSSLHSTSAVESTFLPRIDINDEEGFLTTMEFMKKEAPLPPLPQKSPPVLNTEFQSMGKVIDKVYGDDDDDYDDNNNSIQASPVIFEEPQIIVKQQTPPSTNASNGTGGKFAYQSSSSTLPSHFSNNSSASSSTTVDSMTNNNISTNKHMHTNSTLSYSNPTDTETARQFWQYHNAQKPSMSSTSYAGAAGINTEVDDDDDEELFEDKGAETKSRVKSMFPQLNFYKPLKNPNEEYSQERIVEDGEDEGLVTNMGMTQVGGLSAPGGLYDGTNNDSVLSFNESKTERELEQKSLPLDDTITASQSFRRSLASPVKSLGRLTKKSSRTFSKKLVFSENLEDVPPIPAVPVESVPSVSLDNSAFGQAFQQQDGGHDDAENINNHGEIGNEVPRISNKNITAPLPPPAPLPPHLTIKTMNHDDDEDDDEDEEDNLLPLSPLAPPTRSSHSAGPTGMVMTRSQFDSYRKSVIESGITNPLSLGDNDEELGVEDESDVEGGSESENETKRRDKYDDEMDDKKQNIRMRLKQDAHLSVYRQKMSKVTGSQTALSSYNSNLRLSQSFGNLDGMMMDDDDDDEMDDVPLGILKAHGFPGGQQSRLKTMASQPNLSGNELGNGQGPGVLYQGRGPAETQSLRSSNSNSNLRPGVDIRASAPPLPSVFNTNNTQMNRGLIGEIALAEEAKQRRKSLGGMLNQRASGVLGSNQSVMGLNSDPMQQQMQQMMQMQMQILQQMATPSSQSGANQTQAPAQPTRNWSTYDLTTMPAGRPASIRSFTPSERSIQSRPMSMMPGLNQSNHQRNTSQPALKDLANQEMFRMSRSQSTPFVFQQSPPPPPQLPGVSRPASMMKLVQTQQDDDDDDDDDDQAWEEMLKKRQGLKESWKNRGIAA